MILSPDILSTYLLLSFFLFPHFKPMFLNTLPGSLPLSNSPSLSLAPFSYLALFLSPFSPISSLLFLFFLPLFFPPSPQSTSLPSPSPPIPPSPLILTSSSPFYILPYLPFCLSPSPPIIFSSFPFSFPVFLYLSLSPSPPLISLSPQFEFSTYLPLSSFSPLSSY